jgi:hypothetical protein
MKEPYYTMNRRTTVQWILIPLAVATLSGVLAAYALFRDMGDRISQLVESGTGMKCRITAVHPRFPCGITASGVTLFSETGVPFLQAREMSTQANLLRFLLKSRKTSDLFSTLEGDQIQLNLIRNENGEWNIPRFIASQNHRGPAEASTAIRRRIALTNLTVSIKTAQGSASRFYKGLEADFTPERNLVTVKLSGSDESAHLSFKNGADPQYELQAKNFSLALLAPAAAAPFPLENLILNGKITAASADNKKYAIDGSGTVLISSIHHALLSSRTIDNIILPFDLSGTLSSSGAENLSGKIDLAGETARIRGNIAGWRKPVIDMAVDFSDFSYDRAISALPASLHPALSEIRLTGRMTGRLSIHLDTDDPDSLECGYSGQADPPQVVSLGPEINIAALKSPFLHRVRTATGNDATIMLSPDNPDFVPYRSIPASLISAVMTAEDGSFFSHRGFSIKHIRGSLIENIKAGRVVRGASTISMQLAKNLYLSPERTLSRKLEEALITVALEQNLDKRRILELYLNIIEWGNGIYGLGPASHFYFGKRPEELKPMESAFLASIIARPRSHWRPDPLSKIGQGWLEYLQIILCKMYEMDQAEVEDLLDAGVSESRIGTLRKKRVFWRPLT